jgi:hypothetical protein
MFSAFFVAALFDMELATPQAARPARAGAR